MYEIRIPEGLYKEAAKAAIFQQLSVEEFVVKAVQSRIHEASEEPFKLTAEQAVMVREGLDQVRRGEMLTLEEARVSLEAKKAAFLREQTTKQTKK